MVGDIVRLQPGEIIERNGRQVKVLRNGALQDVETKQIVGNSAPNSAGSTVIATSERARELNEIRWHGEAQAGYKRALQAALAERHDATVIETIEQASGKGIELLASEIALNAGVREDWRIKADAHIRDQAGMSGKAPKQAQQQTTGATLSMDRDTAVAVALAIAGEMAKRGIVDG